MDIHRGAPQIHIHIAVGFIFPLVVAFAFADTSLCVGDDSGYGEVLFLHGILLCCSLRWRSASPLHTFSKCVTHYDTFVPTGRKAVMWALRGGEGGFAPAVCGQPPVFRAMTLPSFPSVVPTPESHRDVAPRWRARSCEVLAHFPRRAVSRWDGHSVFYVQ